MHINVTKGDAANAVANAENVKRFHCVGNGGKRGVKDSHCGKVGSKGHAGNKSRRWSVAKNFSGERKEKDAIFNLVKLVKDRRSRLIRISRLRKDIDPRPEAISFLI